MKRCLQLAKNGLGKTSPNPLVGCVIVWKDQIIGEGWHQKAGEPHAEVNALNRVKNPEKLTDATLYVNLEPCSHYGKTPPCSDLIIHKGIKNVVIGSTDPNPKVAGKGITKLTTACDHVHVGLLEKECDELNKRFLCVQRKKRPYVILKWAQTQDGFIAPKKQEIGKPFWITNSYSTQLVHKWRGEEQGILIGSNTVIKDNPRLNARLWNGRNPIRILIDPYLISVSEPNNLHVFDGAQKTIVFCDKPQENRPKIIFEEITFESKVLAQIMERLYAHEIESVIIEGGRETLQHFIDNNLWDEARVFIGQPHLHSGIRAPEFDRQPIKTIAIQQDTLDFFKND